jgi:hypothetical protein
MTQEQIEQLALHHFPVRHKHNKKGTGEYDPNYPRRKAYVLGASETLQGLWKDAQGDDLPEIDREVIVLINYDAPSNVPHGEGYSTYRVGFGHRPNPDGWDGRNLDTGEVTHYEPKLYDKGGWNGPDIAYWLDLELPIEEPK